MSVSGRQVDGFPCQQGRGENNVPGIIFPAHRPGRPVQAVNGAAFGAKIERCFSDGRRSNDLAVRLMALKRPQCSAGEGVYRDHFAAAVADIDGRIHERGRSYDLRHQLFGPQAFAAGFIQAIQIAIR